MTHDQIVAAIQDRAKTRGVLSHYCHRAVRCSGDRGLPDLVLVGAWNIAWCEVKTPSCPTLDSGQTRWRHALRAAGQIHEVMGERDLEPGGAVDMMLSFVATGAARTEAGPCYGAACNHVSHRPEAG